MRTYNALHHAAGISHKVRVDPEAAVQQADCQCNVTADKMGQQREYISRWPSLLQLQISRLPCPVLRL
jgi:hypothetical protein